MNKYAFNNRLHIRFIFMLALASLVFTGVWFISFHYLPEGLLQSQRGLNSLVRENAPNLFTEWLQISGVNLIPMVLIILFNRLIIINKIPLGYLIPLVNVILYGVFLGTNSFALPLAEPMAPSLQVLTRSGPYEMMAFLLMAVSTHSVSLFEIRKLFATNPKKIVPRSNLVLSKEQWFGVIVALGLLLGAGLREAYMIVTI